jgi:hypothetical protein
MGKAIPAQHPAVVLRSHYKQLGALLAIAMIAVVGLTAAVVILATNDDRDTGAGSATQVSAPGPTGNTRYDGGPEEGTTGIVPPGAAEGIRYDGGPEESGHGIRHTSAVSTPPVGARYDGGPEEGTSGALSSNASANAVPGIRYDGGPEEGTMGSGH